MDLKFSIGTDSECFLTDSKGKFISAVGKIGGSKEAPMPVLDRPGFALQEDNVAVEFNIPPAYSEDEFVQHCKDIKQEMEARVSKMGFKVQYKASATFNSDELNTPQAQTMGCDVDYNAWTVMPNKRPRGDATSMRTTGAHIHVGFEPSIINPIPYVRAMDLFCGVPSLLLDKDMQRRLLYGRAGAFRPKPAYGFEYRVLSGFFIGDDDLVRWMYKQTKKAIEFVESKKEIDKDISPYIVAAINAQDRKTMLAHVKAIKEIYPLD